MYCTIEVVIDTKHARPLCDSRATCHSSYAINDSVCRFGKKLSVSFLWRNWPHLFTVCRNCLSSDHRRQINLFRIDMSYSSQSALLHAEYTADELMNWTTRVWNIVESAVSHAAAKITVSYKGTVRMQWPLQSSSCSLAGVISVYTKRRLEVRRQEPFRPGARASTSDTNAFHQNIHKMCTWKKDKKEYRTAKRSHVRLLASLTQRTMIVNNEFRASHSVYSCWQNQSCSADAEIEHGYYISLCTHFVFETRLSPQGSSEEDLNAKESIMRTSNSVTMGLSCLVFKIRTDVRRMTDGRMTDRSPLANSIAAYSGLKAQQQ